MTSSLRPPLDGDYSIGYRLGAVALSTFLAATIVVTLRLYARFKYAKIGWDDGLMLLALVGYPFRRSHHLYGLLTRL